MNIRIIIVKFLHSIVFFLCIGCMAYIAFAAAMKKFDTWLLLAMGSISLEGIILWLNRCHCPLTRLAEKYGAHNGSVTDIFLPPLIARNTFRISLALAIVEVVFLAVRYLGG